VRTILIFLVESDARTLTLLPYDVACSAPATTAPVSPAPVMPPVPPAMSAPPATGDLLVGQRVTACNYNADLVITVVSVERTTTIAGELAPSGSQWIVLLIDVTNVSTKAEALTSRPLQLRDASGAVYEVQEDPPDITAVADSYGVTPPWQGFVPGITDRSVLTFLVPRNAGALTLAGKRDFCD
jgi:hypothetical protein